MLIAAPAAAQNYFDAPWQTFQTGTLEDGEFPVALSAGDLDGNGFADAVVGQNIFKGGLGVMLNNGDDTFSESYRTPGIAYGMAKLRDLDGDKDLDLLFVTGPSSALYDFFTARGNGDGTFQASVRWSIGACGLGHPAAYDLDDDGDLDVLNTEDRGCFGQPGGDRVYISLNNGDGTFQPTSFVLAGNFPFSVASADFDGDGALDIATSSKGASAVLLGNGDGTFQQQRPLPSGTLGANILALDLNADGHPDLATLDVYSPHGAAGNQSMLSVLLGDGTGAFTETEYSDHPTQDFRDWVASGDVDGDGDTDLMAGGIQDVLLFLNDGAGSFAFSGRYGLGQDGCAPHYADMTGDGVGDLVALVTHEDPPAGLEQVVVVVPGLAGAPGPAVTISAKPVNPPIVVPAGGGMFRFTFTLSNTTASAQSVDFWIAISGPGHAGLARPVCA
jgi:hypothetical protein